MLYTGYVEERECAGWNRSLLFCKICESNSSIRVTLRALSEIFGNGGKAKSDLVETEIAAKREYRSYENYA